MGIVQLQALEVSHQSLRKKYVWAANPWKMAQQTSRNPGVNWKLNTKLPKVKQLAFFRKVTQILQQKTPQK